MQINTNVGEADIGSMKVGQDVEFTVDAYPDITFKGRVWQVRNAPITIQNVVTYDVVIKMDNPELKLKPGMTANVSVIVSIKKMFSRYLMQRFGSNLRKKALVLLLKAWEDMRKKEPVSGYWKIINQNA